MLAKLKLHNLNIAVKHLQLFEKGLYKFDTKLWIVMSNYGSYRTMEVNQNSEILPKITKVLMPKY